EGQTARRDGGGEGAIGADRDRGLDLAPRRDERPAPRGRRAGAVVRAHAQAHSARTRSSQRALRGGALAVRGRHHHAKARVMDTRVEDSVERLRAIVARRRLYARDFEMSSTLLRRHGASALESAVSVAGRLLAVDLISNGAVLTLDRGEDG